MSAEKEASLEENAKTASCFLWSLLGEELTLVCEGGTWICL